MLLRGRGADALDEVGKIEANELEGAEPLVLAELDFVKAAAVGRAALDAGGDVAAAAKGVAAYLAKHAKSHHLLQMQELQGDLMARAGKADEALAAYAQLAAGPGPAKVRAAAAKGALLLSQGKADAADKIFLQLKNGGKVGDEDDHKKVVASDAEIKALVQVVLSSK